MSTLAVQIDRLVMAAEGLQEAVVREAVEGLAGALTARLPRLLEVAAAAEAIEIGTLSLETVRADSAAALRALIAERLADRIALLIPSREGEDEEREEER